MTIARLMSNREAGDVVTCATSMVMRDAVALLAEKRIGALPVMEGDRVAGIFSERDVIYCLKDGDTGTLDRSVREVMTAPAVTVAPGDSVMGALSLMTRRRIRHLPVVENGAVIGLVSIGDLVKYRIDRVEADAAAMRNYIQQA